eukprot:gene15503-biopygen8377
MARTRQPPRRRELDALRNMVVQSATGLPGPPVPKSAKVRQSPPQDLSVRHGTRQPCQEAAPRRGRAAVLKARRSIAAKNDLAGSAGSAAHPTWNTFRTSLSGKGAI